MADSGNINAMAETETTVRSERIPPYILAQNQLQDLITLQKARVARLEHEVSLNNETMKENYVPKDQYEADVGSIQESLRNDYVPKDQYETVTQQLETEQLEHARTKVRLKEVSEKLEEAVVEINKLKQNMEQLNSVHKRTTETLRSKQMEQTAKCMKLQTVCTEMTRHCELREEVLNAKNLEIQGLQRKLCEKDTLYKNEITEAEIEKRQERYIAQMIQEQDRKKSREMQKSVPKMKQNKQ